MMVRTLLAGLSLGLLAAAGASPAHAATPARYNCLAPPTVAPTLPADAALSNQDNFNCFAWQQFIALTWPSKPGSPGEADTSVPAARYGEPGDATPPVWETYSPDTTVFKANALPPDPFGTLQPIPAECSQALSRVPGGVLSANTKLVGFPSEGLSSIVQAGTKYGWVTAQNGKPTYYDVRLNKVEYDYIVGNGFYNALNQGTAATSGGGVLLPNGSIEIKAGWLEITDHTLWPRYRMTQTIVVERSGTATTCRVADMGLVAIHIIQKTPLGQQFVWTSFEHVDNQPTYGGAVDHDRGYAYYNPKCDPNTDYYKCEVNREPTCKTVDGVKVCDPVSAPVQVMKIVPMTSPTAALNADVQASIRAANPASVYQHYQLVDSLWPNDSTTIPPHAIAPLYNGDPQPTLAQGSLLNPLIETYFQGGDPNRTGQGNPNGFAGCQSCHAFASIAAQPMKTQCTVATIRGQQPGECASDYSFLFEKAQCPAGTTCNQ